MPIPHGPHTPPLRIVTVGFHGLRTLLEELAPHYHAAAEVRVLDKAYGDAVAEITAMRKDLGVDAVVSAGSNGGFLRQHLDLPVILVKVGGFDVMHALTKASRHSRRIALVTYGAVPPEIKHFNEFFSLALELRTYRSEQEAEICVQELRNMAIDVVVAPGLVVDLARAYGLEGVLLYSQASVREAMDDAIEVARIARLESAKRERLNLILGKLKDGVVAVDLDERIETLNPSMERILGQPAERLLGQRLSAVCAELSLRNTLRYAQTDVEQVQQVNGKAVVATRMSIVEQGKHTGAVLICQDPVAIQRLDRHLRARVLPRPMPTKYELSHIIGLSASIVRAKARALTCAQSHATVLIIGESGTGKELLAQGIHNASPRRAQPFVAINCAAFPETLLESELFGYVEGAFTGSSRGGKIGLFEAAHTGSIFLDEIGEMPLSLQTRLLRVLQEKEVLRIGATEPTPVDVRVIAATHRDLGARALAGDFRSDLYYRLNILLISLPPLRERHEDLPMLAAHLQEKIAQRLNQKNPADNTIIDAIAEAAKHYSWPGNVRELENLIERAMVFHDPLLREHHVTIAELKDIAPELFTDDPHSPADRLRDSRDDAELRHIRAVLQDCQGDRARAAARLNISRTTLWRKLKRSG